MIAKVIVWFSVKRRKRIFIVILLFVISSISIIRVCDEKPTFHYFSYNTTKSVGWLDSNSRFITITFLNLLICDKTAEREPWQTMDNTYISLYKKDGSIDEIVISGEYVECNGIQYKSRDSLWNLMIYMLF